MALINSPEVRLALVAVSRDCFPIELPRRRMARLVDACKAAGQSIYACKTIIENDKDALAALDECVEAGANAAVIYLGNFGPEGPLAIFAENFPGPVMACGAAEETKNDLIGGRGDAYCGMLNASYNFGLRSVPVHIPQMPIGLPEELAGKIKHFEAVARCALGVMGLKIFTFGPRPQDFYACNAPIKQLYDLGIEVMENSELDLFVLYKAVDENDPAIAPIAADMASELGAGNTFPDLLPKLARFELALMRFMEANLGSRDYGIFADKCWPAFEPTFGFVPCYVNSRMASKGIPIACEVDIYGALSEYLCQLASDAPATLLDINNTVPPDMVAEIPASILSLSKRAGGQAQDAVLPEDLFMGFHCGNTPSCHLAGCSIQYQLIMHRLMEDATQPPDITRGTLEGRLRPGPATFFRLQGSADGEINSYIAEGNILDVDPRSFGGIGVFGIPNFARFYRHVLIGKQFPHHGAVAFDTCGKALFDAVKLMGVDDISVPLPAGTLYPGENPFE